MTIILNELSLNGQFNTYDDFIDSLLPSVQLLSVLNDLNIEMCKNQTFYNLSVTSNNTLNDFLISPITKSDDIVRGLRGELFKTYSPPFWEESQKHTCNDTYDSTYTAKKCEYGLAEAVERDKVVFSFFHQDFTVNKVEILKNKVKVELVNLASLEIVRRWIIGCLKNTTIVLNTSGDFFPFSSVSNKLIEYDKMYGLTRNIAQEDRIAIYEPNSRIVALINGWEYSSDLSHKNDRTSFYKTVKGEVHYMALDTENGAFEIYNSNPTHLGEYLFNGKKNKNAILKRVFSL